MASSKLYKNALSAFEAQAGKSFKDNKDRELLENFLAEKASPQQAADQASQLKNETQTKFGDHKVGKIIIPRGWIDNIIGNIQNFIKAGNFIMQGAPESIGLAWFAVKITLTAIQSDYELYALFGSGLTDITQIMVLVPHYDRLYEERAHGDLKDSPMVATLFENITNAYVAVLNFSFAIKRHVSASPLRKAGHIVTGLLGMSKSKFQGLLDEIMNQKNRVLEDSMAAFQESSIRSNERFGGILEALMSRVGEIKDYQSELANNHKEQMLELRAMNLKFEAYRSATKEKTPWDYALQRFDKTKAKLEPMEVTGSALQGFLARRFAGTCQWVFSHSDFEKWHQSQKRAMLCITGAKGTGKSTLLVSILEYLGKDNENLRPLYFSCETNTEAGSVNSAMIDAKRVCSTLLYQLYQEAVEDNGNATLLDACNAVFSHPKTTQNSSVKGGDQRIKAEASITETMDKDDSLPGFSVVLHKLCSLLKRSVVIFVDAVDLLREHDQIQLLDELRAALDTPTSAGSVEVGVKIVIGCRLGESFQKNCLSLTPAVYEIDVGEYNGDDMKLRLTAALEMVGEFSHEERETAKNAIILQAQRAESSFSYITEIGIPFIRQPFQGPMEKRLEALPQGMPNTYNDALQKMGSNYIDLLRFVLTWVLLSPVYPTIEVVMDAFRRRYEVDTLETGAREIKGNEDSFPLASSLEKGQLEDAMGPFLNLKLNDGSESFVYPRNRNQVWDFCVRESEHEVLQHESESLCSRCSRLMTESNLLRISEKAGHLEIALVSLRHLNNKLFQRRAQLVRCKEINGDKAQESLPELPDSRTDQSKSSQHKEDNETEAQELTKEESPQEVDEINDNDSDDSMDDEDRETNDPEDEGEEYHDLLGKIQNTRYEIQHWPHHLRRAEDLWPEEERVGNDEWSEIFDQLKCFVENTAVFNAWQEAYNATKQDETFLGTPHKSLHVASYLGLTSWAKYILDGNADPNELSNGFNALQASAQKADRPEMLKLLLERGGDINATEDENFPAFHDWLRGDSSLESVKLMLEHGANPLVRDLKWDWSALHHFALSGQDPSALDLLLNHSVAGVRPDINAKTRAKDTPLHILLWRREVPKELLKAFLERGADVNQDDDYSVRPLQLASYLGVYECLEILLPFVQDVNDDDDGRNTALHFAATCGHTKCVELLLQNKANPNTENKHGRCALHSAVWYNHGSLVQCLLEHGANLNQADKHDRTPLFFACLGDSQEMANSILDRLLEKKLPMCEINKKTKKGRTPLRQAASHGFTDVVKKLINAAQAENDTSSLHINEKDTKHGMTPLHRASLNGHAECVRYLLDAEADVRIHAGEEERRTALVLAYERWALDRQGSYETVVSSLIELDPLAAKDDAELLAVCAMFGSSDLIHQLQTIGANFNLQDRYGWTPLDLARKFQRHEIEKLLRNQETWTSSLPSRWVHDDLENVISEDGLSIIHTTMRRVCISTNRPIPAGLDEFYFEITFKSLESVKQLNNPIFAIGFCILGGSALRFPGWPPRENAKAAVSWAYHGDDGGFFNSANDDGQSVVADPRLRYGCGDTVGCGVDLTTQTIWFTLNGKKLEHSFSNIHGRLFPVIGLRDSVNLSTNFKGPFMWKKQAD